jgi:ribose 5-phosphate isomerase B
MKNYDLIIANDHAGYSLKTQIIEKYSGRKMQILDLGSHNEQRVDYPDFASAAVNAIIDGISTRAILICGTGIGMSIAANRSSAIRAALCTTEFMARKSREHNDANILILGSKITDTELSLKIVDIFLNTSFDGGRHIERLAKIR